MCIQWKKNQNSSNKNYTYTQKNMNKQRTFDPTTYINQFYITQGQLLDDQLEHKFGEWCRQAFQIIQPCQYGIEIGCGPVLLLSAFASRKVTNIVLTQYNVDCFKFIDAWMRGEKNQFYVDWGNVFSAIAKIQGTNQNIEERVRKAIFGCYKIDLNQEQIFQFPFYKKVDVIFSRLCIQSAATDDKYFKRVFGNLKKYLNKNGYIFLLGILEETYYIVGKQKLPCHYVTKQLLQQSMSQHGFQIVKLNLFYPENPPTEFSDWKGLFSLLARLNSKADKS